MQYENVSYCACVCLSDKKSSTEEVSSPASARKLSTGKEIEPLVDMSNPSKPLSQGKKRGNEQDSSEERGHISGPMAGTGWP